MRKAPTLDGRIDKAMPRLRRLKHLPISSEAKAKAIRTVVYPAALYGIEVSQSTRPNVAVLAAAVKDVLHNRNNRHDTDSIFTHAVTGRDLDPEVQTVLRRCAMIRRGLAKRPKLKEQNSQGNRREGNEGYRQRQVA